MDTVPVLVTNLALPVALSLMKKDVKLRDIFITYGREAPIMDVADIFRNITYCQERYVLIMPHGAQ